MVGSPILLPNKIPIFVKYPILLPSPSRDIQKYLVGQVPLPLFFNLSYF